MAKNKKMFLFLTAVSVFAIFATSLYAQKPQTQWRDSTDIIEFIKTVVNNDALSANTRINGIFEMLVLSSQFQNSTLQRSYDKSLKHKTGDMAIGLNYVLSGSAGVESFFNQEFMYGFMGKFQYNVSPSIRLEPSFVYFLEKHKVNMWQTTINTHYLIPLSEVTTFYPKIGIGAFNMSFDYLYHHSWYNFHTERWVYSSYPITFDETVFAIDIGAGLDFNLDKNIIFNIELNYKILTGKIDDKQLQLATGFAYRF